MSSSKTSRFVSRLSVVSTRWHPMNVFLMHPFKRLVYFYNVFFTSLYSWRNSGLVVELRRSVDPSTSLTYVVDSGSRQTSPSSSSPPLLLLLLLSSCSIQPHLRSYSSIYIRSPASLSRLWRAWFARPLHFIGAASTLNRRNLPVSASLWCARNLATVTVRPTCNFHVLRCVTRQVTARQRSDRFCGTVATSCWQRRTQDFFGWEGGGALRRRFRSSTVNLKYTHVCI